MRIFLASLLLLSAAVAGALQNGAKAVIPEPAHDFGRVPHGSSVEHDFVVRNEGDQPLQITNALMTTGLLVTKMPAQIAPGQQGMVRVKLDAIQVDGIFEGVVSLATTDATDPEKLLSVKAVIYSGIELGPIGAFFVSSVRGTERSANLELISHESEPLLIERVEQSSSHFQVEVETLEQGKRYRLHLRLASDAPAGKREDKILLHTSSAKKPVLPIPVNTYVRERVHTFPEAVDMGRIRLVDARNPRLMQRLMVYQAGGTDFKISASTDVDYLRLTTSRAKTGDRYLIAVTFDPKKVRPGEIAGKIVIRTNDPKFASVSVPVRGAVLKEGAR